VVVDEDPPLTVDLPVDGDSPLTVDPPVDEEPTLTADPPVDEDSPLTVDPPVDEDPPLTVDPPEDEDPPVDICWFSVASVGHSSPASVWYCPSLKQKTLSGDPSLVYEQPYSTHNASFSSFR